MADVEPFVALQPDQLGAEHLRQHLGDLGLADAGLAFEEQRPLELQREVDGDRQPAIGDVALALERLLQLVDGHGCRRGAIAAVSARLT